MSLCMRASHRMRNRAHCGIWGKHYHTHAQHASTYVRKAADGALGTTEAADGVVYADVVPVCGGHVGGGFLEHVLDHGRRRGQHLPRGERAPTRRRACADSAERSRRAGHPTAGPEPRAGASGPDQAGRDRGPKKASRNMRAGTLGRNRGPGLVGRHRGLKPEQASRRWEGTPVGARAGEQRVSARASETAASVARTPAPDPPLGRAGWPGPAGPAGQPDRLGTHTGPAQEIGPDWAGRQGGPAHLFGRPGCQARARHTRCVRTGVLNLGSF